VLPDGKRNPILDWLAELEDRHNVRPWTGAIAASAAAAGSIYRVFNSDRSIPGQENG
jgi:hypothetical protein